MRQSRIRKRVKQDNVKTLANLPTEAKELVKTFEQITGMSQAKAIDANK